MPMPVSEIPADTTKNAGIGVGIGECISLYTN